VGPPRGAIGTLLAPPCRRPLPRRCSRPANAALSEARLGAHPAAQIPAGHQLLTPQAAALPAGVLVALVLVYALLGHRFAVKSRFFTEG
jgi:hypothetical protein